MSYNINPADSAVNYAVNALFKQVVDVKETQYAYALKYFPYSALSGNVRKAIVSTSLVELSKEEFLERMDSQLQKIYWNGIEHQVVWMNNNIPTETEWNKIGMQNIIEVEFRITHMYGPLAIIRSK